MEMQQLSYPFGQEGFCLRQLRILSVFAQARQPVWPSMPRAWRVSQLSSSPLRTAYLALPVSMTALLACNSINHENGNLPPRLSRLWPDPDHGSSPYYLPFVVLASSQEGRRVALGRGHVNRLAGPGSLCLCLCCGVSALCLVTSPSTVASRESGPCGLIYCHDHRACHPVGLPVCPHVCMRRDRGIGAAKTSNQPCPLPHEPQWSDVHRGSVICSVVDSSSHRRGGLAQDDHRLVGCAWNRSFLWAMVSECSLRGPLSGQAAK